MQKKFNRFGLFALALVIAVAAFVPINAMALTEFHVTINWNGPARDTQIVSWFIAGENPEQFYELHFAFVQNNNVSTWVVAVDDEEFEDGDHWFILEPFMVPDADWAEPIPIDRGEINIGIINTGEIHEG